MSVVCKPCTNNSRDDHHPLWNTVASLEYSDKISNDIPLLPSLLNILLSFTSKALYKSISSAM